ncbi:uncharacterized protein LOC129765896 [Toxorhynchites rutilus septentrionalis]|uniref:uncharacterized protein LOC129765896 n=1 Tax=Toxorhynchites rutilus septentrionalis TaxID=329112 RepID=UPI0024790C9C|nr:uncharacterized protein LOC129765896 [Toxorhynchites rutilus septentrionalis]
MPAPAGSVITRPPSLRLLFAKLKDIQSSAGDIRRFIENFRGDTSTSKVEIRLEKLDELWEKFGNTVVEIRAQDDYEESADLEREREEFSDRYYEAKSFLVDRLKERETRTSLEQSVRNFEVSMSSTFEHVRLPQIKLQTFSGDIDEWLSFRDLFKSLIHNKTDLPDVEKLHYLKGCLQGEPKSLIDPLQITAGNYQIARDCLLKRYNNSKQLKKRQIQALMKLPTLTRESSGELHTLVEGLERMIKILDQIVQPDDYKDLLLINIVTTRLDPVTRRGWEEFTATKEQETYRDLIDFLQQRVQVLDSLPARAVEGRNLQRSPLQGRPKPAVLKTSFNVVQGSEFHCFVCTGKHWSNQCEVFRKMAIVEKEKILRKHNLCRNCFRKGHRAMNCSSKISCRRCKGRHHTLMCFRTEENIRQMVTAGPSGSNTVQSEDNQNASTSASSPAVNLSANMVLPTGTASNSPSQTLLATVVVVLEDDGGNRITARALLDSGSESNFISVRLSQRLNVNREMVDIPVMGIDKTSSRVKQRIHATVRSRNSNFAEEMGFLVLPKMDVKLPTEPVNITTWTTPEGIRLADPLFSVPMPVDIVFGIEAFFNCFESGRKIGLGEKLPTLHETVFGWVVCGGFEFQDRVTTTICNMATRNNWRSNINQKFNGNRLIGMSRSSDWFSRTVEGI